MIINRNIFVIYFFLFFSVYSQAQHSSSQDTILPVHLEEVMVTATKSVRQLSALPLPVQLISKREIQGINAIRMTDLLNETTGLTTVSDFGGGQGIQMQGLDAQHTLILIDGLPLIGRAAGTFDLNRLAVGNIEQVEIVKGASSSLYGSEALAGVINLISKKSEIGFHGNIGYRLATFNTQDAQANISYATKKFDISVFANRLSSDGYDLKNDPEIPTVSPYENQTFSTALNYQLNKNSKLHLTGRVFDQRQDYIGYNDLAGETNIDEWNVSGKFKHTFNNQWETSAEVYITRYYSTEYLNEETGTNFSESDYDQRLIRPEIKLAYSPKRGQSFIGGLGYNHETLQRTDFSKQPEFNAPYIYAQYDGKLSDRLNIIAGARYDMHSEYTSQLSPKLALRYVLSNLVSLKGSVGYGFKAPDFRQLYFDFSNGIVGYTVLGYNAVADAIARLNNNGEIANQIIPVSTFNENLKPENSISYNIGADFRLNNNLKINLNLFRNNINHLIDTQIIATKTNGQSVFSYTNVNKVYTQGFEINSNWQMNEALKISAGYQLLYAKDKDAVNAFKNGAVFARENASSPSFQLQSDDYFGLYNRSRHMANIKLFYQYKPWKIDGNIRTTYRSTYGQFDGNGNGYLDKYDPMVDGYVLTDIAINKSIYKHYRLSVGVNNVFNYKDRQHITNIPGSLFYTKLNIQF
ncbi:TonB-dependent receptor [Flavobacteriaceae bacterium F08102]|nr:TonB-dependent receptor [Flavobacteriaceae bacterium F08102]